MGMLAAALALRFLTANLRQVFWLAAIPGLVAVLLVTWGIGKETVEDRQAEPLAEKPNARTRLDRGLLKWYAVVFVFWLGNSADAFLILKAHLAKIPVWQLPLLMLTMSAVSTVCSTPAGMLSDRLGRRGIIVAGWVYYAAVYAAFAFVESHLGLFLLFGAYGLFYALTEGAERALVADLAPAHRRATALGVYHFVVGAAALPASIICGSLWQWRVLGPLWGPRVALGFGSACALAASALFLVLKPGSSRRVEPQDEAQGR